MEIDPETRDWLRYNSGVVHRYGTPQWCAAFEIDYQYVHHVSIVI